MGFIKSLAKGTVASNPQFSNNNGIKLTHFDFAYKDGWVDCYLRAEVFGKNAELALAEIKKGDSILIEGRLRQERIRTDDGKVINRIVLLAQTIHVIK